ncbi:MAG: AAA family ATPase [Roseburia intestinalis]|nr:AAA family ATPase [Roseburia intestinalis]
MNIKQAKEEIKHTVAAYLSKDAQGEYRIPVVRQRPILLMGPPGIGKTQIMEQIAMECKIGLVAYTITHHTRQSAVGLPMIKEESFDGKIYPVTEYTMSEIIASIYHKMKKTGQREGILFIDEINCVSETLAPTMLQFLQCKTFGNQAIPEGWLIVAAGNPPEYNKSVRDFDMVTLDRVRYLNIEADYKVWKEYAREKHLHNAILSYLELRQKNFYRVEADVDGIRFVTARGWEDLSNLMQVYEEMDLPVDEGVIREFIHHEDVAEDATAYFELYRKYRDDYGITDILAGRIRPETFARIYAASFDERLSVVNLLLDGLSAFFVKVQEKKKITDNWYEFLKEYQRHLKEGEAPADCYQALLEEKMAMVEAEKQAELCTKAQAAGWEQIFALWKENMPDKGLDAKESFAQAKTGFDIQREALEESEQDASDALEHAFDFMEQAFEDGEEMVVFVTELTLSPEAAMFLAEHTCDRYMTYNEQLLIGKRKRELLSELKR